MAKIAFSLHAQHLNSLVSEGRRPEAHTYAAQQLRAGQANPLFLEAVAALLEPPSTKRGRPPKAPTKWYEIGQDHDALIAGGATYEGSVLTLAARYRQAERTVERAISYYRQGQS